MVHLPNVWWTVTQGPTFWDLLPRQNSHLASFHKYSFLICIFFKNLEIYNRKQFDRVSVCFCDLIRSCKNRLSVDDHFKHGIIAAETHLILPMWYIEWQLRQFAGISSVCMSGWTEWDTRRCYSFSTIASSPLFIFTYLRRNMQKFFEYNSLLISRPHTVCRLILYVTYGRV
jgi:hypothetical protein